MTAIELKLSERTTEELMGVASLMLTRFEDGSDLVMEAVLNELENRLPECEFVEFCNELVDLTSSPGSGQKPGTLNRDQLGVILVAVEQQIKKQEEN